MGQGSHSRRCFLTRVPTRTNLYKGTQSIHSTAMSVFNNKNSATTDAESILSTGTEPNTETMFSATAVKAAAQYNKHPVSAIAEAVRVDPNDVFDPNQIILTAGSSLPNQIGSSGGEYVDVNQYQEQYPHVPGAGSNNGRSRSRGSSRNGSRKKKKKKKKKKPEKPWPLIKGVVVQLLIPRSGLEPTIWFDYPPRVQMRRRLQPGERLITLPTDEDQFKKFNDAAGVLKTKTYWERNCIKEAFSYAGFQRTPSMKFNGYWGKHFKEPGQWEAINGYQRVNHFPGSWAIGRKDRIGRIMSKMRRRCGVAYDFLPQTYILPGDRPHLLKCTHRSPQALWIKKPCASSCGRGIRILNSNGVAKLPKKKVCIIQKYVANPYLINGTKFDLRVYVLVRSFNPLRIYMFKEGLARFCTEKYSNNSSKLKQSLGHLTNYSLNSKSDKFTENQNDEDDSTGNKWSLSALLSYLEQKGKPATRILNSIREVIIKTIIAGEPEILPHITRSMRNTESCYEVFGFDLMLDAKMKVWLIEVNISPALMAKSPLDKKIKGALIADTMHTVGYLPIDIERHEQQRKQQHMSNVLMARKKPRSSVVRKTAKALKAHGFKLESLDKADCRILAGCEDELIRSRSGNLQRIFPPTYSAYSKNGCCPYDPEKFVKFFESLRYKTALLLEWHALQVRCRFKSAQQKPARTTKRPRIAVGSAPNAVRSVRSYRDRHNRMNRTSPPKSKVKHMIEENPIPIALQFGLNSSALSENPHAPVQAVNISHPLQTAEQEAKVKQSEDGGSITDGVSEADSEEEEEFEDDEEEDNGEA